MDQPRANRHIVLLDLSVVPDSRRRLSLGNFGWPRIFWERDSRRAESTSPLSWLDEVVIVSSPQPGMV